MKINHAHRKAKHQQSWKAIEPGTVFYGTVDEAGGRRLLLRTFGEMVDLENPRNTWASDDFEIEDYLPVVAEVTVLKVAR